MVEGQYLYPRRNTSPKRLRFTKELLNKLGNYDSLPQTLRVLYYYNFHLFDRLCLPSSAFPNGVTTFQNNRPHKHLADRSFVCRMSFFPHADPPVIFQSRPKSSVNTMQAMYSRESRANTTSLSLTSRSWKSSPQWPGNMYVYICLDTSLLACIFTNHYVGNQGSYYFLHAWTLSLIKKLHVSIQRYI